MLDIIKKFLSMRKNIIVTDCIYVRDVIEFENVIWKNNGYEVLCYDKGKKVIYHQSTPDIHIKNCAGDIMKSNMVIVKANMLNRDYIIKQLGKICETYHSYAPIIYFEDGDILFFPKLRYQDGYFIKRLVQERFQYDHFCVAYGNSKFVYV